MEKFQEEVLSLKELNLDFDASAIKVSNASNSTGSTNEIICTIACSTACTIIC